MEEPFEPIPEKDRAEWDRLIKQGKTLVTARDKAIWKLVFLAGKVEGKYGEGRIKRFADEIGLSSKTLYEYSWLNRAGVNEEFIKQYSALSYSLIREVLRHTGKVENPTTEYFLKYAQERKITVRAMQAFMMETVAPDQMRERAAETIKMALQDKQEAEGFSDYIKTALEQIAEEHPELEDQILRTAIVDVGDLQDLKIAAGISTDDEEKMAGQAKYQMEKVKSYYRHLVSIKQDLIRHLENGHENADDLRFQLSRVRDIVSEILETEFKPLDLPAGSVEEVPTELVSVP